MKSKLSFSGSWPFQNSRSMHSIDVIAQPVIPCSTGVGHVQNKHTNYVFLICSSSHMKKNKLTERHKHIQPFWGYNWAIKSFYFEEIIFTLLLLCASIQMLCYTFLFINCSTPLRFKWLLSINNSAFSYNTFRAPTTRFRTQIPNPPNGI